MSAPDEKDPKLQEFDWDSALAEWDKAPFEPEVAKEKREKEKVPARPAYAPPDESRGPISTKPAFELADITDDDDEPPPPRPAVTPPRGAPAPRPAPPKARGGLGHLFSRQKEPAPVDVDVSFDSGEHTAKHAVDDDAVVTSARDVSTHASSIPVAEPLRRPSLLDTSANVPDGAMFDPFAEPPPRAEVPTVHPRSAMPDSSPKTPKAPPVPQFSEDSGEYSEVAVDELLEGSRAREDLDDVGGATRVIDSPAELDELLSSREPVLAPETRKFDPDAETFVGESQDLGVADVVADMKGEPEVAPPEPEVAPPEPEVAPAPIAVESWDDERPASAWLPEESRAVVLARADWLQSEARALPDAKARAQGLLVASELAAMAGDAERAARLAKEATEADKFSALAERQYRALAPRAELPQRLTVSIARGPTPQAKLHDRLLAYELARAEDATAAEDHLKAAAALASADPRVLTERTTAALAKGALADPAITRAPEGPIAAALQHSLRARGQEGAPLPSPSDAARRARVALEKLDAEGATVALAEIEAHVPELSRAVAWLGAMFGALHPKSRARALAWLRGLAGTDELARRTLTARALEDDDVESIERALADNDAFAPQERLAIAALVGARYPRLAHDLDAAEATGNLPLVSAVGSILGASDRASEDPEAKARAIETLAMRAPGEPATAAAVRLGRMLGAGSKDTSAAIAAAEEGAPGEARALGIHQALQNGEAAEISVALQRWSDGEAGRAHRLLAGALVAERAGLAERALEGYRQALELDPACEASLRATAALDASLDPAKLLLAAAEKLEGSRAALLLLEAYSRSGDVEALVAANAAAPNIPIASFLAERAARHAGDVEGVLRWIRERRALVNDPLEIAMDAVREALLIVDSDPSLASEKLEEAHRAKPRDVALRELYERLAVDPPRDRAAWREQRAATVGPPSNAILLIEAALEYERSGDADGALRAANAAIEAGAGAFARAARERAELASGQTSRLADELLATARSAEDPTERREAYERLAHLDAVGRSDAASALLWHRSILEESPGHLPSLRLVEHAFISERRDDELEPIASAIAKALAGSGDPESIAHAELAVRLRLRVAGDWPGTRELSDLAAKEPEPPLWALRMANAHARWRSEKANVLATTEALIARATRSSEIAAMCARAAEAALAVGERAKAIDLLQRATSEDPGDVAAWALLAAARERAGQALEAAEAFESLARTSVVEKHQLEAWYRAAVLFEGHDPARAGAALEAAGAIDLDHADVFDRLMKLHEARGAHLEIASLLERRIATLTDPEQRALAEVQRGKALSEAGELAEARRAFDAALALRPDHAPALLAAAELSGKAGDWESAEQSLVQLARLAQSAEDQRAIYLRLGEIYTNHLVNLSRAELAYKEVLKRAEGDVPTLERLVELYKKQNDAGRAIETQQEIIAKAPDHQAKRKRLIELALIHETVSRDVRKAEQTLEQARREFAGDVGVLRALADFYLRHKQTPALNILLDRAVADAKRAFAGGRFTPALFETVAAAYELRDKKPAARVVQATLAAFTAQPADLRGVGERACDPALDDLLAPEVLSPAVRALLAQTGAALDLAVVYDLKKASAQPIDPSQPLARLVNIAAQHVGVANVQVYVGKIGRACVPAAGASPILVAGEGLLEPENELARAFLVLRALKMLQANTSALARVSTVEAAPLLAAWLRAFVPQWTPQGPSAAAVSEMSRRLAPGIPRQIEPSIGMAAVEAVGAVGGQLPNVALAAVAWANRAALLAVGDPNAAFDALAWAQNQPGAPKVAQDRANWIARTPEAKDLVGFSVSEPYAEARARLGLA